MPHLVGWALNCSHFSSFFLSMCPLPFLFLSPSDIQYPEEHFLRVPKTVEEIIKTYGGKPVSDNGVIGFDNYYLISV